jgi:hypothetical protein
VLKTDNIAISFFANSENFVDKIFPTKEPSLSYGWFKNKINVTIYQDFSIEKELLTDNNVCEVAGMIFLKIITPFTRERTYDFIVARSDEMEKILKELHIRREKANFASVNLPIIGIDFNDLKKETIDFLLNEDFRAFCVKHRIPLKRGIVIEGPPGNGKTLSLRWLKEQALQNKISFQIFRDPKNFMEEKDAYLQEGKKIFVFEDFDAFLKDRKTTEDSPNSILASILNILEGIDEIKDVVSVFTTNRIFAFDEAFLRPGRVDKVFTFNLPTEENTINFLKAYLPEYEVWYAEILKYLHKKSKSVSYAILKGICDDINIVRFSGEILNIEGIKKVIDGKLKSASRGKTEGRNMSEIFMKDDE